MRHKEYIDLIYSDYYRITGTKNGLSLLFGVLFKEEAFKYIFWMRTCKYSKEHRLLRLLFYPIARVILRHLSYKFGISIPPETKIGEGFYIGHFGGIVVNSKATIGNNCNISHCVTIGQSNRGKNKGYPTIGNNVYIGPGAKIIGSINIGNNVAIGANCVVTKDIPDNAVVVGIPAKIISYEGSIGYINRIDY